MPGDLGGASTAAGEGWSTGVVTAFTSLDAAGLDSARKIFGKFLPEMAGAIKK
jgi:hypothetical protein